MADIKTCHTLFVAFVVLFYGEAGLTAALRGKFSLLAERFFQNQPNFGKDELNINFHFIHSNYHNFLPGGVASSGLERLRGQKRLFADDLYQYPFPPLAVKFPVENLFPGAKVELTSGNGCYHFPPHDLPFHMRIGVYLAGIVAISSDRFMWRQFFKPYVKVVVQPRFIIVDKNTGGNVHGVYKAQSLLYSGLMQQRFYLGSDIDKFPFFFGVKP
jgi:hypothetical protein